MCRVFARVTLACSCAASAAVASVGLRLAHATHRQRPDSATPSPRCRHPAGVPGAGQGARGRRHRRVQPRHQFRRRWLQLAARRHPAPCHPRLLLPGSRWLCARRATLVCKPQRQVHTCPCLRMGASLSFRRGEGLLTAGPPAAAETATHARTLQMHADCLGIPVGNDTAGMPSLTIWLSHSPATGAAVL